MNQDRSDTGADSTDVIIVGSGAAGSALAARLAEGGKKIVILEAGPDRSNKDLISSQIWARRLKWSGPPVIETGNDKIGHIFNTGYGVGGSALHHFGVWPRLHPEDFNSFSSYERGLDWPIAYEDLKPWYDQVQQEVGISGDAEQETWRPDGAPYPMGPVPVFAQGHVIKRGFDTLGIKTAPLPLAITTRPYNGRPACIWDGWCDAGCPTGALANPLTVYLPKAKTAGAILTTNATVTRILTTRDGTLATGVEYAGENGSRKQLLARVVVLAAFSVQNPRLLLASASEKHPNGLANSSDCVGRYIMTHPAGSIYGLFDDETLSYLGAVGGQLLSQDGYDKLTHRDKGAFGSYQWMIAQAVKPNDLLGIGLTRPDLFGSKLQAFMERAIRGFATMTAVAEDLPDTNNRLILADEKDHLGVPLAKVTHTTHPESKALWQAVMDEGQAIFKAAGAQAIWTGPQAPMHIMGGTIMGSNPMTSVTNSFGQTHDIPNLVIAGPGLFPTSGGVNPTYTVHALAMRTSRHLLDNWNVLTA